MNQSKEINMLTNDQIKEIALQNGFKLKEQPGGEMDLNPYVYHFARALVEHAENSAVLQSDCMINQEWYMVGTPVKNLIDAAAAEYQAEVAAQNSKIEFATDDNVIWYAHDVPYFGSVQINKIIEHGFVEWSIYFNGCWSDFSTKQQCIQYLEECVAECRETEKHDPAELKEILGICE